MLATCLVLPDSAAMRSGEAAVARPSHWKKESKTRRVRRALKKPVRRAQKDDNVDIDTLSLTMTATLSLDEVLEPQPQPEK